MVEFLLLLCFILILLFMMPLAFSKRYLIKSVISAIIIAISIYLIPAFYQLQSENGNPDLGKEFEQLYMPISIFAVCAVSGFIMLVYFLIKLRHHNQK